jgi:hypothetical protein
VQEESHRRKDLSVCPEEAEFQTPQSCGAEALGLPGTESTVRSTEDGFVTADEGGAEAQEGGSTFEGDTPRSVDDGEGHGEGMEEEGEGPEEGEEVDTTEEALILLPSDRQPPPRVRKGEA